MTLFFPKLQQQKNRAIFLNIKIHNILQWITFQIYFKVYKYFLLKII